MHIRLIAVILLAFIALSIRAQDEEDTSAGSNAELGSVISGSIDNRNPRAVYYIDGLRGEVIKFTLTSTSGNLDPILTVFDNTGELIFSRDDTRGSLDIEQLLTLTKSDRYYVVVARFGYTLGSTSGDYELRMERAGVLSEQGSTLRYGDSVIDTISDINPQVYYTFQANTGDIVNIAMVRASGTLDPYIQIVNSERFVVADNDDQFGADSKNARIEGLLLEDGGTYIIIATRYGAVAGDSAGNFVLTIEEASNSGLGNSTLAPSPITVGEIVENTITNQQYERFYSFTAQKDDLITLALDRGQAGRLDAYLILANAGFLSLIEDDDGGNGQNARITDYRIPANGTYYVIVTRYEGKAGTSEGAFRLRLETQGNAFEDVLQGVQSISYGITLSGNISDETPEQLYAFYAEQGDNITISMNRSDGNLDSVIELLNSTQNRILRDDDSGNGQNARVERYEIPITGLYYIRATRYNGNDGDNNTSGTYTLVLAERVD